MKKYLPIIATLLFIVPSVAFASWWNPISWNWSALFNSPSSLQVQTQVQTVGTTTSPTAPSSTSTSVIATTSINIAATSTPPASQPIKKFVQKVSPTPVITSPTPSTLVTPATPTASTCPQGYSCAPTIPAQSKTPVAPVSNTSQSCTSGLTFDKSINECVTDLTYCQNQNGANATYNSTNNSCSCATGYTSNSNNICAVPESGYQICSEQFPNETWDGTYSSSGKYNCACKTGYTWNGASCQIPQQSTACQEAIQAVQTAQNQYNTLEAQNSLSNISNNPNALANLGTGSAGNMSVAIAQNLQILAQSVTYALEEQQVVCQ